MKQNPDRPNAGLKSHFAFEMQTLINPHRFVSSGMRRTMLLSALLIFALSPLFAQRAYLPSAIDNSLSVVDLYTNEVIAIKNGVNLTSSACTSISVSPDGRTLYITNADNTVSVLHAATLQVQATIAVSDLPSFVAHSPDGSIVYVSCADGTVNVINSATLTVDASITVGSNPQRIIFSPDGSKAYVANGTSDDVSVIDVLTSSVVATIAVGSHPNDLAISQDGSILFVTNSIDETLISISTSSNFLLGIHPVSQNGIFDMCISPDGDWMYITNTGSQNISVVYLPVMSVLTQIPLSFQPYGVTISADGSLLYVADVNNDNIRLIDLNTNTELSTIAVCDQPVAIGNFVGTANWYWDLDGDGFGNPASETISAAQPIGYVMNDIDCDDNALTGANINIFSYENPINSIDDDCDGIIDEAACAMGFFSFCNGSNMEEIRVGSMISQTGCDGYYDFSSFRHATAYPGETVSYLVRPNGGDNIVGLYIDYNGDADFDDANEVVFDNGHMPAPSDLIGTFTIPSYVSYGSYTMRFVCDDSNFVNTQPCFSNSGEAEDYKIIIQAPSVSTCIPNIIDPCNQARISGIELYTNSSRYTTAAIFNFTHTCGTEGYTDNTAIDSLFANAGQAVQGSIFSYGIFVDQIGEVYIDYNNDNDFNDINELAVPLFNLSADYFQFLNFNIPNNIPNGDYRMRFITRSVGDGASPCQSDIGEAEDYNLHIVTCQNEINPPTVDIVTYADTICSGEFTYLSADGFEWNGSDYYEWTTGSCGGTIVLTSTGGLGMQVAPLTTTTYYVRGKSACITPGACTAHTVTVLSPPTWYLDNDGDGYSTGAPVTACSSPGIGYVASVLGGGDCNDNNAQRYPGAIEICNNNIDENCDGTLSEGCPANAPMNDSPANAVIVSYSSNMNFPNCYPITSNTISAGDSPESVAFSGGDVWFRFTAQSTGISITMNSASFDDAIALYSYNGVSYTLIDSENSSIGNNDFERLNFNGLTSGDNYYVSVGAASGTDTGPFSLCIQHLMPSGCASLQPNNGFSLCNNFKALFRGAPGNGVLYSFQFQGIGGGASGITSLSNTNGLINLAHPALALSYGGIYSVDVSVHYSLLNSANVPEIITVSGTTGFMNCSAVTMMNEPRMEVKASLRCPATLLRNNYLIATKVAGDPASCGAVNYTFEFTQVSDCTGNTTVGVPFERTTSLSTPYLLLAAVFPPGLSSTGYWKVRVRSNYTYGPGSYGTAPYWVIQVNNSSTSSMLNDQPSFDDIEKSTVLTPDAAIYPNPNSGRIFNINIANCNTDKILMRIINQSGQLICSETFMVEGSLNVAYAPATQLSAGLYMVEFVIGDKVQTEKFMVE